MGSRALARLVALALALAACGSAPEASQIQEHVLVTSAGIGADGFIDARYTCDGADEPLPLTWTGLPEAKTLGVTMQDRDADGFIHWVLVNLNPPAHADGLNLDVVRPSPIKNDFGRTGYGGPCPPPGDGPHEYEIKVHTFPASVGNNELEGDALIAEIERERTDGGTLIGLYERKT